MSAICGVFSHFGDGFENDDLASMMQILSYRGISELIYHTKKIAFGKQKSIIESEFDEISNKDYVIVADARITNRKNIFRQLEIPLKTSISDTQIILKAYQKWGRDCPKFLLGEFAFAIWDKLNERLFCCRDHLGISPFFYFQNDKKIVFASEPKAILGVSGVEKKINQNRLATLVIPQSKFFFAEESWFKGIKILPAGKSLTIDKNGSCQEYFWQPDLKKKLPYKTDGEMIEALRELFFEIIEAYLESPFPVSALLSGGLDSSSIVAAAAKILEKQNKILHTFSAVLPDENDKVLIDERFFIDQFRNFPNVEINYVTAPNGHPFENIKELVWRADCPSIISRHYLNTEFANLANSIGSRTILGGGGGEFSVSFHGDGCYAEMFSKLEWLKLWRELSLRRKMTGEAIRYHLRFNILNLFFRRSKTELNVTNNHPFLQIIAEKYIADIIPKLADFTILSTDASSNHRINQHNLIANIQRKTSGGVGTGAKGVEFRNPLIDIRLIEFCLAAPSQLKVKDGYKRYLVRTMLDNILPPKIQWRNSKNAFSPDYLRRYNRKKKWVQDFFEEIKPNDPICEIIDINKLKEWAKIKIADDEKNPYKEQIARDFIPNSIYLIYFLRRFSEFQN